MTNQDKVQQNTNMNMENYRQITGIRYNGDFKKKKMREQLGPF